MASDTYNASTRNLRDGVITIEDGTTPTAFTCTLPCEAGDLQWTESTTVQEVKCRGAVVELKEGEENACTVSFSVRLHHFLGYSNASSDPITPPEILDPRYGGSGTFESTSDSVYATNLIFTLKDPRERNGNKPGTALTNEIITFAKFTVETLEYAEGEEYNILSVTGKIPAKGPTIARET